MIPEAYGCHESPILPPYASVSKERRYAVEGTAPHRIALRVLMGIFREISGKSRKECRALRNPQPHLAEAEGNLNPHKPLGCR